MRRLLDHLRPGRFAAAIGAVSAVEFALIAPAFGILIAGTIDLGAILSTRFKIDNAVSAASNFALVNATRINATNATNLAQQIAGIVAATSSSSNGKIVVNNGPIATITAGAISTSGVAANADFCYCPTKTSSGLSWGASVTCGSVCTSPAGLFAGRFVSISTSQAYTPLIVGYGMIKDGTMTASAVVQAQ